MSEMSSNGNQGQLAKVASSPSEETWISTTWRALQGIFVSDAPSQEEDADAVVGWVGGRNGRRRCRSIGGRHGVAEPVAA
ncbi:hypothetical protein N7539_000265 [Penicillium diatomitis]|uniref:Uncharacterized protein n=1 Tax=Penicillium diatomitis TaxID=2819901 RepID=A0A9W9XLG5_9EURO|nr:uncharacterized protein N7539_000265 [Penicillium diatomitis]KAJ5495149.1 hypothetical protein N7539_000265 [Penicillium diatomitis]